MEDELWGHPFYQRAAKGLVSCYLQVRDIHREGYMCAYILTNVTLPYPYPTTHTYIHTDGHTLVDTHVGARDQGGAGQGGGGWGAGLR